MARGGSGRADPLAVAAIVALVVVGVVAIVDLATDGRLDAGVLALLVSVAGPLVPALILRTGGRDGHGQ